MNFSENLIIKILPLIDKELFDDVQFVLQDQDFDKNQIDLFMSLIQQSSIDSLDSFFPDNEDMGKEIQKMKDLIIFLKDGFNIVDFQMNLGIVRGLDYYTGVVFEIKAPKLGAEKQICGGGEYELIGLFNGRKTPTSGFALGFDRTILAMELSNIKIPTKRLDFFIIPVTDEMIKPALNIAIKLRNKGFFVDIDLMKRGMGKAMKYAGNQQTKKTIIVGPDEYHNKQIAVKDMDSGEQTLIELDELSTNET